MNYCHFSLVAVIELAQLITIFAAKFTDFNRNYQWAVELGTGPESVQLAKRIARDLHLRYAGKHGAFDDVHIFEGFNNASVNHRIAKRSADYVGDQLRRLSKNGVVERQVPLNRVKRSARNARRQVDFGNFNDPFFQNSWYLNGAVDGMNIKAAWKAGYTGFGVVVSVLDDGIERNHPDLKPNYDSLASYDFNARDSDPTPRYDSKNTNQHGTRCAGQIAAVANNSACTVGVAFNARIGGVRMLDGQVTDAIEADAMSLRLDHVDIFSASWGPPDDGKTVEGPGHLARRALLQGATKGRDGRGVIYVWSSGDGGIFDDSCACDGYANSIYTLSISSASERGQKPWYLEECPSTLAATYSSGDPISDRQVVTTDLRGGCTLNHTGTSASAPVAAGLVALTLEANPGLTWRDVQHIVVETARPEPLLHDGQFLVNGVGRKVSSRFGFGLMDALGMVKLAKQWKNVPDQHICTASLDWMSHQIPPDETLFLTAKSDACAGSFDNVNFLEHVEVRVTLWYSIRGDVEIYLTSPLGTTSQLLPRRSQDDKEGEFHDWSFTSVQFWGEQGDGNWTLEVNNVGSEENKGSLKSWTLILYGTETAPLMASLRRKSRQSITKAPTTKPGLSTTKLQSSRCQLGSYLLSNSTCVKQCPDGFCANNLEMTCDNCVIVDVSPNLLGISRNSGYHFLQQFSTFLMIILQYLLHEMVL